MKRIIFNLKKEWYDKIASGEKTVEYRQIKPFWMNRLDEDGYLDFTKDGKPWFDIDGGVLIPKDTFAVFRMGYDHALPDIVRRIVKIDIGPCPYDGWDGEYFRIHFEKGSV